MLSAMVVLSYITAVHPYISIMTNRQEIFNETTVLIASYTLLVFTPIVWELERKKQTGWLLVGCIVLNIGVNIVLLTFVMCKSSIFKVRVCHVKYLKR